MKIESLFKVIDLSKGDKHTHPDIKVGQPYMCNIQGKWWIGTFVEVWYGLLFTDGPTGSYQFDTPGSNGGSTNWQAVVEVDMDKVYSALPKSNGSLTTNVKILQPSHISPPIDTLIMAAWRDGSDVGRPLRCVKTCKKGCCVFDGTYNLIPPTHWRLADAAEREQWDKEEAFRKSTPPIDAWDLYEK